MENLIIFLSFLMQIFAITSIVIYVKINYQKSSEEEDKLVIFKTCLRIQLGSLLVAGTISTFVNFMVACKLNKFLKYFTA